jgi:two-component system chemotaxis response regulator CheY
MKILIVDDSKAMRMIIRRTLRNAGYDKHTISEAGNGVEALALVRGDLPDLILTDWNMPEMSGLELMTAVRKEATTVKFGFITTEGSAEKVSQAIAGGAVFLIAKPFTVEDFQKHLGGLLA